MKNVAKLGLSLLAVATVTMPSNAQMPVDKYHAVALTSGQYNSAMTGLEAQLRANPRDESLLLNLAMAYRHAGRIDQSDALYEQVLRQEEYELDAADGSAIGSHVLARRGLAMNAAMVRTAAR